MEPIQKYVVELAENIRRAEAELPPPPPPGAGEHNGKRINMMAFIRSEKLRMGEAQLAMGVGGVAQKRAVVDGYSVHGWVSKTILAGVCYGAYCAGLGEPEDVLMKGADDYEGTSWEVRDSPSLRAFAALDRLRGWVLARVPWIEGWELEVLPIQRVYPADEGRPKYTGVGMTAKRGGAFQWIVFWSAEVKP